MPVLSDAARRADLAGAARARVKVGSKVLPVKDGTVRRRANRAVLIKAAMAGHKDGETPAETAHRHHKDNKVSIETNKAEIRRGRHRIISKIYCKHRYRTFL